MRLIRAMSATQNAAAELHQRLLNICDEKGYNITGKQLKETASVANLFNHIYTLLRQDRGVQSWAEAYDMATKYLEKAVATKHKDVNLCVNWRAFWLMAERILNLAYGEPIISEKDYKKWADDHGIANKIGHHAYKNSKRTARRVEPTPDPEPVQVPEPEPVQVPEPEPAPEPAPEPEPEPPAVKLKRCQMPSLEAWGWQFAPKRTLIGEMERFFEAFVEGNFDKCAPRPASILLSGTPGIGKTFTTKMVGNKFDIVVEPLPVRNSVNEYLGYEIEGQFYLGVLTSLIKRALDQPERTFCFIIDEMDSLVEDVINQIYLPLLGSSELTCKGLSVHTPNGSDTMICPRNVCFVGIINTSGDGDTAMHEARKPLDGAVANRFCRKYKALFEENTARSLTDNDALVDFILDWNKAADIRSSPRNLLSYRDIEDHDLELSMRDGSIDGWIRDKVIAFHDRTDLLGILGNTTGTGTYHRVLDRILHVSTGGGH